MKRLLLILIILISWSCDDIILPEPSVQLVLEGWVEDGKAPVVIVTTAVPVETEYNDVSALKEHVVRWGKVTISDGTDETVLSGRIDKRYFPQYIYTKDTYRIKSGQTYSVNVQYGGETASASVTVPQSQPLEYIRAEKLSDREGTYRLVAGIRNKHHQENYKFFVKRVGKDSTYMSCFLGYINSETFGAEIEEVAVYNGMSVLNEENDQYFTADDIIDVKFCVLDGQTWQYWKDYEELTTLARNPFFPVSSKIRSNVTGGLGYWSGYGATYYRISIPDYISSF